MAALEPLSLLEARVDVDKLCEDVKLGIIDACAAGVTLLDRVRLSLTDTVGVTENVQLWLTVTMIGIAAKGVALPLSLIVVDTVNAAVAVAVPDGLHEAVTVTVLLDGAVIDASAVSDGD